MARGKVGDVVFTRLDGEQITRVRNRHPKNPRTNKQLFQRAVMATVMQAYSAGKEIFDHSFQGYPIPAGSQRRFMSLNAKELRRLAAVDLKTDPDVAKMQAKFVFPGATSPVPFYGMIVSDGSYEQRFFEYDGVSFKPVADTTEGLTLDDYSSKHGLIPGDLYTLVLFFIDGTKVIANLGISGDARDKQVACSFSYLRLRVKDSVVSSHVTVAAATYNDLFEFVAVGDGLDKVPSLMTSPITTAISIATLSGITSNMSAGAMIRSREDEDLRSRSVLSEIGGGTGYGLIVPYVLEAWKDQTVGLGDSELILEGGDI